MKTASEHHSHSELSHAGNHSSCSAEKKTESIFLLAVQATLHCLLGCGLGEIAGIILGTYAGLNMMQTMTLGISLGFIFGFSLGIIPLIRSGFGWKESFKMILVSEGLSILVMESAEAGVQIIFPSIMNAGLGEPIFWYGMLISLSAGFAAALPVNMLMIRKGIRHHH